MGNYEGLCVDGCHVTFLSGSGKVGASLSKVKLHMHIGHS
ncbi:hypothetical protein Agau_P100123 (plasmid) [Agrobacterium tumefaciens F2]|nr:hypothetical protein Agau_P100123 [Agrobacterium tumefaciens F2]CUX68118.1 conserved hypothetical protein [Agrobacterium genomosp. 5 str. CFBP 6626]